MKLYQAIVQNHRLLSIEQFRDQAEERHCRLSAMLPSGGGFDLGTEIVSVSDSKIVFSTSYHHMNENGMYCGWTEHKVTVKPSLMFGIAVTVSGKDKNGVKGYIADVFRLAMYEHFEWVVFSCEG